MSVDLGEQWRLLTDDIEWLMTEAHRTHPAELAQQLVYRGWLQR